MNQRNDCKDRQFIAIPGVSHKDFCTVCAQKNLSCFLHRLRLFLLSTVVMLRRCHPSCTMQSVIESVSKKRYGTGARVTKVLGLAELWNWVKDIHG